MTSTYEELKELVERLFKDKEDYYQDHPHALAGEKHRFIVTEMLKIQDMITEKLKTTEPGEETDKPLFLRAKLFSLLPDYDKEIERILTRYLKFYPRHGEAWNILGELYCKNGSIDSATDCFSRSIEMDKNSRAFRCMAMMYRSLGDSPEEIDHYLVGSLKYGRDACAFDAQDGKNWYSYGTSYMTKYFKCGQDPQDLSQALKAYTVAYQHAVVRKLPDFHYSRAIAFRQNEEFGKALQCFDEAILADPHWDPPKLHHDNLLTFMGNCQELIANKGKAKARLIKKLLQNLKPSQIGPYAGKYQKKTAAGDVTVKLIKCTLSELDLGLNSEKLVCGKVVCHIYSPDNVTFAFCMIDDDGPCYAVHVYNLAAEKGVKIGDSVAIPEPFVTKIDFTYGEKEFKFQWIKVMDPLKLVVNGKLLPSNTHSETQFNIVITPEWLFKYRDGYIDVLITFY